MRLLSVGSIAPAVSRGRPCRVLSLGGCVEVNTPSHEDREPNTRGPRCVQEPSALADLLVNVTSGLTIARSRVSLDDPQRFVHRDSSTAISQTRCVYRVGGCCRAYTVNQSVSRSQ